MATRMPVVAVVAAAGARGPLERFFGELPPRLDAAFVVIDQSGEPPRALFGGRKAVRVSRRLPLEPERVCFAAYGGYLSLAENFVFPVRRVPPGELPADYLLRALADECGELAVAVMLGDPGRDGLVGAQAVDAGGGLVAANVAKLDVARMEAPAEELAHLVARHVAGLPPPDIEALAARLIGGASGPAAVLVDRSGEILYVHGRTGDYLEPPSGCPNWNVVAMARPGLRDALAASLPRVLLHGKRILRRGLAVETDAGVKRVDLVVEPAAEARVNLVLVRFAGGRV